MGNWGHFNPKKVELLMTDWAHLVVLGDVSGPRIATIHRRVGQPLHGGLAMESPPNVLNSA